MSDSSGNSVKIQVNMHEQKQLMLNETSTTVTINGMQAGRVNKLNNSSIIFLGDCEREMPITKSENLVKTSGSDSGVGGGMMKKTQKSHIDYTQKIQIKATNSVGDAKQPKSR